MTKLAKLIAVFTFTLGCGISLSHASDARDLCLEACAADYEYCTSSPYYYCIRAYNFCLKSCPAT